MEGFTVKSWHPDARVSPPAMRLHGNSEVSKYTCAFYMSWLQERGKARTRTTQHRDSPVRSQT